MAQGRFRFIKRKMRERAAKVKRVAKDKVAASLISLLGVGRLDKHNNEMGFSGTVFMHFGGIGCLERLGFATGADHSKND